MSTNCVAIPYEVTSLLLLLPVSFCVYLHRLTSLKLRVFGVTGQLLHYRYYSTVNSTVM